MDTAYANGENMTLIPLHTKEQLPNNPNQSLSDTRRTSG